MPETELYQKIYHLRLAQGERKNSIEVTFPYNIVENEARKNNLTVSEFIKHYQAVVTYNNANNVSYSLKKIPLFKANNQSKKTDKSHKSFLHNTMTYNDPQVRELIKDCGASGYGFYIYHIEAIYSDNNFVCDISTPVFKKRHLFRLRLKEPTYDKLLNKCFEYKLFDREYHEKTGYIRETQGRGE